MQDLDGTNYEYYIAKHSANGKTHLYVNLDQTYASLDLSSVCGCGKTDRIDKGTFRCIDFSQNPDDLNLCKAGHLAFRSEVRLLEAEDTNPPAWGNLTFSWEMAVQICLAVIENDSPAEVRRQARFELLRLARAMDEINNAEPSDNG